MRSSCGLRSASRAARAAGTLAIALVASARATEFAPQFLPTLEISRTTGEIHIDGELTDPGWIGAARASGFAEVSPGDQTEPTVPSEVWVTYDEQNLYVALIAGDDPEEVRASLCDRDAIFRDDYFGVMIDPYGDQSSGYELFVNPLGIQGDLRMLADGDEDMSFDALWESRGRVTDSGYQVELAIPFASLRLPDRDEHTWRVNFWRDHQRDVRRRYAWAAQDRDNPCFMCQWGELKGLSNIATGRPVEVIVSAIGSQAGSGDPDRSFDMDAPTADASVNGKYALSPGSFVEIAVNPDFSQVESDEGQIDVNETFALYYDERRPFFQEGSDLLGTWIDAIYTRSINDPNVAAKFTGQYDRTSVVYLAAQDARSPILIPLEERSRLVAGDRSFSNIVRVRRSLLGGSHVGALFTDRRLEGGGSGTVGGVDGLVRRGRYVLEIQTLLSHTAEPTIPDEDLTGTFGDDDHTVALDGESFGGHGLFTSLEFDGRTYNADLTLRDYSPEFRTDNGFITRNDYRQVSFWNGWHFLPDRPWLPDWQPDVEISRIWSASGTFKDEWIRTSFWLTTKGQTQIGGQYLVSRERFGPEVFPGIRRTSLWIDSRFSEVLHAGLSTTFGRSIYRDFDDPELADLREWSVDARFRPSRRLEINTSFEHSRMNSRERAESLFSGYLFRTRVDGTFTRELFLRLVVQYDGFSKRVDVEPLLTYRVNPFTMFFLGATSGYEKFPAEDFDSITTDDWRTADRQLFAKLQYQFRL